MAVTEYERNRLFSQLEELMGKEPATTMMNLLPPVGWGDVATRRDLDLTAERLDRKIDHLEERVNLRFEVIDQRLDSIEQRFDQRFDGIDQRFDGIDQRFDGIAQRFDSNDRRFDGIAQRFDSNDRRIDGVAGGVQQLRAEVHEVRSDLQRTFVTWLLASQAAVIAVIGVLLTAVR